MAEPKCPKATLAALQLVAAATPKLPTFNTKSPALWFARAESEFRTCNPVITQERTKFDWVVKALDEDTALRVADLMENPSEASPYSDLKAPLQGIFALSDRDKASRVLDYPDLGDTPAAKMVEDALRWLGGDGETLLVKELLFRRLPENIRVVLENDTTTDLRELAKKADKLRSTMSSTIAGVQPNTARNQQGATAKQSSSASGICRFHKKFGPEARNCQAPCLFAKLVQKNA